MDEQISHNQTPIYFVLSLLVLLIVYFWFDKTRHEMANGEIVGVTKDGARIFQPDDFLQHIYRLRNNLRRIRKKFSKEDCQLLKEKIMAARQDINKFIDANRDTADVYCDSRSTSVPDREALKSNISRINSVLFSDSEMETEFQELMLDLEFSTLLVKNSMCKNGVYNLGTLNDLLQAMYDDKCGEDTEKSSRDKLGLSADDSLENDEEEYFMSVGKGNNFAMDGQRLGKLAPRQADPQQVLIKPGISHIYSKSKGYIPRKSTKNKKIYAQVGSMTVRDTYADVTARRSL